MLSSCLWPLLCLRHAHSNEQHLQLPVLAAPATLPDTRSTSRFSSCQCLLCVCPCLGHAVTSRLSSCLRRCLALPDAND